MSDMRQDETREMGRTSVYEQDALSNGQTATIESPQAATRTRAMDILLPQWTEARRDVAEARGDVEGAKGELKHATEVLGRVERNLEHVAACRLTDCLVCEAIALNGARVIVVAEADETEDDSEAALSDDEETAAEGVEEESAVPA